jgi:voltage-gated potassium channel
MILLPVSWYRQAQQLAWDILDGDATTAPSAKWIDVALLWLIVANVLAVVLGTVRSIEETASGWLSAFELFSVGVFTLEYLLRLWSAPASPAYRNPVLGRLRYAATPMALIDLLAVLPFFAGLTVDLRVLRVFRAFRLLRLAKLGRYLVAFRLIGSVVHEKRRELAAVGLALIALLLTASSILYYVEHDAQPDKFASIPDAMWWGIATMTTVGYGDVYPVTPSGRVVAGALAVVGIAFFALPAAIVTTGFLTHITPSAESPSRQLPANQIICPHCGGALEISGVAPATGMIEHDDV